MINRFLTVVMLLLVWALPAHAFTPASFIKTQCVSSKIVKISWMACSEKKASRIPSVPRSWIERSTCQPVSTTTANCTADSYCTSDPAIVSTPQCVKPDFKYPETTCGGPSSVTTKVQMKGKITTLNETCPPATPQCVGGKCVAAGSVECVDSDQTNVTDPYSPSGQVAGQVTVAGKIYYDTCKTPLYLQEMACSPSAQLQVLGVNCGETNRSCKTQGKAAHCVLEDMDKDAVANGIDNCPTVPNPDQKDGDDDGKGDACDNCLYEKNSAQEDWNKNGLGDMCECSIVGAKQIASNAWHTCALIPDGTVRCWGYNKWGQLGDGTKTNQPAPVTVKGIDGVTQVATANGYTSILLQDGSIKLWGHIPYGKLADGVTTDFPNPVTVKGITAATQVGTGNDYTCAVLQDGSVWCWGYNNYGQLGNGVTSNSLANPDPVPVKGISAAVQISTADQHACAVLQDGAIRCWGGNSYGQFGNGTTTDSPIPVPVAGMTAAKQVAASQKHSCAVLKDGTVRCWGDNTHGQLGDGTTKASTLPVEVKDLSTVLHVTLGQDHSCALLQNGSIRCWGADYDGQLGNGSDPASTVPVTVQGLCGDGVKS